jgi:hypothetical protein
VNGETGVEADASIDASSALARFREEADNREIAPAHDIESWAGRAPETERNAQNAPRETREGLATEGKTADLEDRVAQPRETAGLGQAASREDRHFRIEDTPHDRAHRPGEAAPREDSAACPCARHQARPARRAWAHVARLAPRVARRARRRRR